MKSSIKKILVASTLFAGVLAGCSGGQNSSGGNSGGGDAKGDTIKIGANLELSGEVASYGQSISEGMELAIEEINDSGGVDGKKIKVVKVDNKSDNAEAASAATRLTSQENVLAIIGAATSGNTIA